MTDEIFSIANQTAHIRNFFEHLTGEPAASFDVAFTDDETIIVTDASQSDDYSWVFEIPSDDDGYYYFNLTGDLDLTVKFPYPSELVA